MTGPMTTPGGTAGVEPSASRFSSSDDEDNSVSELDRSKDENSSTVESSGLVGEESGKNQKRKQKELASKETTRVKSLRAVLMAVLLVVATGTSVGLFLFTRSNEISEFKAAVDGHGSKVVTSFQDDALRKLQALASLSTRLTAYALDTNATWPFVTVAPHSDELFEPYRQLANVAALQVMPIVAPRQRDAWEEYAVEHQDWIHNDLQARQRETEYDDHDEHRDENVTPYIKNYVGIDTTPGRWIVWWQYAPVIPDRYFVNFNRLAWDGFAFEAEAVEAKHVAVLSSTWNFKPGLDFQSTRDFNFMHALLKAGSIGTYDDGDDTNDYQPGEPVGYVHSPVFDRFRYDDGHKDDQDGDSAHDQTVVAILTATVYWRSYFTNILPDNVNGMYCVVENSFGQVFTYLVDGPRATFLGMEDLHDPALHEYERKAVYGDFFSNKDPSSQPVWSHGYTGVPLDTSHISYTIRVYPSETLRRAYVTTRPYWYAATMLSVFLFTVGIFKLYDGTVEARQKIVHDTAVRTTAVVESLFPENVRGRLMEEVTGMDHHNNTGGGDHKMSGFMNSANKTIRTGEENKSTKPIADFFPAVTIMFADLVGFTAWSSVREPAQVFILLENVYSAFDDIAKKRGVFKVETVGDCYVAVAGLPRPRRDHAVVMTRFASDCLHRLRVITTQLEVGLGPGTGDLTMRFGLHSGAVTAGVLRGDRSRFQLFGDTVNTASRMESTGQKDRIHVSEETAELLRQAGKDSWILHRQEKVVAKGKGEVNTYWVHIGSAAPNSSKGSDTNSVNGAVEEQESQEMAASKTQEATQFDAQLNRLVRWNAEVLTRTLKQVVAHRLACGLPACAPRDKIRYRQLSKTPLEEVAEIITLPKFKRSATVKHVEPDSVELGDDVEKQILDLVMVIAQTYNKNFFHNFKHATHVTMSVTKLLSRIVAPQDVDFSRATTKDDVAGTLHDHTYGITSDPLTQFACVFAALVHDADHHGIPNSQLVKEKTKESIAYNNRSVAEQNSLDLTWALLMDERYADLRDTICSTQDEFNRFRQLTVNLVMATDIMDKDLKTLRNDRWDKAFHKTPEKAPLSSDGSVSNDDENKNRKATIVIEHLIQASDVAHTMQHWHVYRQWNECLFKEMYQAYQQGRAERNPAEFWYNGEIGFFDFYILPLARKLKECGVFGVSSDEYLNYALRNRNEWVLRGAQIVAELVENCQALDKTESSSGSSAKGTAGEI